jgi:hypothetical protein
MNQQQGYLAHADNSIRGLKTQQGTIRVSREKSSGENADIMKASEARLQREIDRLTVIREELATKLSGDELAEYQATRQEVKTAEQRKLDIAAATKAMNENKDRPSH